MRFDLEFGFFVEERNDSIYFSVQSIRFLYTISTSRKLDLFFWKVKFPARKKYHHSDHIFWQLWKSADLFYGFTCIWKWTEKRRISKADHLSVWIRHRDSDSDRNHWVLMSGIFSCSSLCAISSYICIFEITFPH